MPIRRYDVREAGGRVLVARSRTGTLLDIGGLVALFLLGLPGMVWVVSLFGDTRTPGGRLRLFVAGAVAAAAALYAFLLLLRAYRGERLRELLTLDRAADAVARGDRRLCGLRELARVELRRRSGRADEAPWYEVVLMVSDDAPTAITDEIPVAQSAAPDEMRASASRIAAYAGVPVEEKGF